MALRAFYALLLTVSSMTAPGEASQPQRRIFTYRDAEEARRLAQRECKPLVIHFIPDSQIGAEQLEAFYNEQDGVPQNLMDRVVIVLVPTEKYVRFARRLGVTDAGGYRTISAFDLTTFDQQAVQTYRSGFV
jgi:hypothetical protein